MCVHAVYQPRFFTISSLFVKVHHKEDASNMHKGHRSPQEREDDRICMPMYAWIEELYVCECMWHHHHHIIINA